MATDLKDNSLDFILETHVGGGGRWQWKQFLLLLAVNAAEAPFMLHLYSAYTPSHRSVTVSKFVN